MSDDKKDPTVETNEVQEVQLNVQHISFATQIIDTASERGAFKGPELSSVGQLRDLFAEFVNQNTPNEEPAADSVEEKSEDSE
jgi:hypothetical protein